MNRKIIPVILTGLLLLNAVNTFAQTSRGVGVLVKNDAGQTEEINLYDKSYALIIGASSYNNGWQKLPGVKSDVVAVKDALSKQGFVVEELVDPTSDNLLSSINRFVNKYGLQSNNRLLIYFAGHGYTEKANDGRQIGYVVPVDAPDPSKNLLGFQQTSVTMDDIETVARKIRSKHALFLFDSCFSGTLLNARRSLIPPVITMKATQPVRQFITAGAADQEVPDNSIFRKQFTEGIGGDADRNADGYITASELADFLQEKVTNYTRGSQTPQYGKIFDSALDKGDFIFVAQPSSNQLSNAQPVSTKINEVVEMHYNNGIAYHQKGEYDKAVAEFTKSIELDSKYEPAYHYRGLSISYKNEHILAIIDFTKSIQLNPRNAYSYIYRGNMYYALKDFDKAVADYSKAIELIPNDAYPYTQRGIVYVFKRKYDLAKSDLDKAIQNNPSFDGAWGNRGWLHNVIGKYDLAIADYTRYLQLKPSDSAAYDSRGWSYLIMLKFDEAISDFNKAIELDPRNAKAFHNRGVAYVNKQKYDLAISDYTKVIELTPKDASVYRRRAIAYDATGRKDLAEADRRKAQELEKEGQ